MLDWVIPPSTVLEEGHMLSRLLEALLTHHIYICMFSSRASCSRVIRFLSVSLSTMTLLFFDTLFFGICYPDQTLCPSHSTEVSCLAEPSKIEAGASLCEWDPDAQMCSLISPPHGVVFIMITSMFCFIFALPLDQLGGYILGEYAMLPRDHDWRESDWTRDIG